jgi:hypothetical protein
VFRGDGPRTGVDLFEDEMSVIVGGGLKLAGALRGNESAGDGRAGLVFHHAIEFRGIRRANQKNERGKYP